MDEQSLWEILLDAGLAEEDIEEILMMSSLPGQGRLAETQYEQAQALRRSPWPRGRWTGRTYTRAHPMEHIAAGVDRAVGGIQANKQMEQQRQLLQEQARLRAALSRAMLQGARQNPPGAMSPPPATGSMSPAPAAYGGPMSAALRRIDPYQLR